jgi:hypothetical protein
MEVELKAALYIIIAAKTKVKTGWSNSRQIWQIILKKVTAQRGLFCQ